MAVTMKNVYFSVDSLPFIIMMIPNFTVTCSKTLMKQS